MELKCKRTNEFLVGILGVPRSQSGFRHFPQEVAHLERLLKPSRRTCGSIEICCDRRSARCRISRLHSFLATIAHLVLLIRCRPMRSHSGRANGSHAKYSIR
jgi:hypothetical protein